MLQSISFLGTSAGCPSKYRNVSAHALSFDSGKSWLLDCGEGTQQRIMTCSTVRSSKIDVILITHLHGDHCFGLPGLLATISLHRERNECPLTIVGPKGLKEMVEVVMHHSATVLNYAIQFVELENLYGEEEQRRFVGSFGGISVTAYPLKHRVPCWGYIVREPDRRGKINMKKAKEFGLKGPMIGQIVKDGRITVGDREVIAGGDF